MSGNHEEYFAGQLESGSDELDLRREAIENGLSLEQRTEWLEAKDRLTELLKEIDAAFSVELDEAGLGVGMLDKAILGIGKAPALFIHHGDKIVWGIQGERFNPRNFDHGWFGKNLEKHVEGLRKWYEKYRASNAD